ncbi:MAG: hypothetical protein AB8D78_13920 [Akkermansiaceae bacterium]
MKSFRFIIVLLGCLHLCGGQYGVMQMLAWGKMIVEYSSERGFVDGLSDTFDGEHPCELCHSIQESKKRESQKPASHLLKKLELKELFPCEKGFRSQPRSQELSSQKFIYCSEANFHGRPSPETPPPRVA